MAAKYEMRHGVYTPRHRTGGLPRGQFALAGILHEHMRFRAIEAMAAGDFGQHIGIGYVVDVIAAGQPANHDVASITASYAYRFKPSVYIQPGVGASRHRTITARLPIGVNLYLGMNFLF